MDTVSPVSLTGKYRPKSDLSVDEVGRLLLKLVA